MASDRPDVRAENQADGQSAYGQTASALSALGRAREHALSDPSAAVQSGDEQTGASSEGRGGAAGAHVRGRRGPRLAPLPGGSGSRSRRRRASGPRWRRRRRPPGFARKPQHRPHRGRSARSLALRGLLVVGLLVLLAGVYTLVQVTRSVPSATARAASAPVPATQTVPGHRPAIPWPSEGEAAVAVAGYGTLGTSGAASPVPIASLAKVMAAVVLLRDHPLRPGQAGPTVTITAAEAATYRSESAAGDSVAPVTPGEHLTELELLQALLIPSADNIATVIARWDAGSDAAFAAKMNAAATALGMHHSHYADVNGLSSGTTSTAGDQLRLAEAAVTNAALMSIVRQPSVILPDGTVLTNYDTLLGHSGVVGIKTGSTLAAGGCFMLAAQATVSGHRVTVLGVVLGQHTSPFITTALHASGVLVAPVLGALHALTVLPAGTTVASVTTPWGQAVPVRTTRSVAIFGLAGSPVRVGVRVAVTPLHGAPAAGSQVATVTVSAGGRVTTVPAVTAGPVPSPTLRWRLERL
jgi:D-alanyl-D-alanine carboxypeptidase (penicillin-binding protein 5/6)